MAAQAIKGRGHERSRFSGPRGRLDQRQRGRRLNAILKGEAGAALRISVKGGGCSGFQYSFDVDRARAEDDVAVTRDGATVLVDPVSLELLKGAELDFVDDLMGQSFRVKNPNAVASCGCGVSFSV